jgi:four helix bundle protein
METVKSFRDLEVWKKSHQLVLEIYRITSTFPKDERFGIISQLRRAAYSIPANMAEGFGRRSTKELLQFLAISNGSIEEIRYFLFLSCDLSYLGRPEFDSLEKKLNAIAQMIAALSRSLKSKLALHSQKGFSRDTGHGTRNTNAPSVMH